MVLRPLDCENDAGDIQSSASINNANGLDILIFIVAGLSDQVNLQFQIMTGIKIRTFDYRIIIIALA